jgi:hypothetical protein
VIVTSASCRFYTRSNPVIAFLVHLLLFAVFSFLGLVGFAIFMATYLAKRNPSAAMYWANILRRILGC